MATASESSEHCQTEVFQTLPSWHTFHEIIMRHLQIFLAPYPIFESCTSVILLYKFDLIFVMKNWKYWLWKRMVNKQFFTTLYSTVHAPATHKMVHSKVKVSLQNHLTVEVQWFTDVYAILVLQGIVACIVLCHTCDAVFCTVHTVPGTDLERGFPGCSAPCSAIFSFIETVP